MSGFVVDSSPLIDTAIGNEFVLTGVVTEVLDEQDRAISVEVAPKPILEIELVNGTGVLVYGEPHDVLSVGAVLSTIAAVSRCVLRCCVDFHSATASSPGRT